MNYPNPAGGGNSGDRLIISRRQPASPFLYILGSIILFSLLSAIILSVRFAITGAIGNEGVVILNDTGSANLTSITIGKLGSTDDDGQPITVTYSDGSTLTPNRQAVNDDGTNRNEVLNNDEVVYNVNLDVTNPGQITLVFTMPANSTISEASVSSANGCLQGSKVGRQSTVGSDGESDPSYTNNQATCVINPGSAKSLTWSVSTNPWGGDGEQIRPSLTSSGRAPTGQSPQSMPVVTTIGRGDYGITVYTEATNSAANGLDRTIYPSFGIYGKKADQTGALGLAPLSSDGDWVLRVNTSNLPAGWTVASTTTRYLGAELSLILDKSTLSTTLEPGATDTLTNTITLNARTSRGYNLTM